MLLSIKSIPTRKRDIFEIRNEIYAEWRDNGFLSYEDKIVYLEFYITLIQKKDKVDAYKFLYKFCTWESLYF